MKKGKYRTWTDADTKYLEENYGFVSIDQVCSKLKATRHQARSKAAHMGLTRRSKCGTCGKVFIATGKRKRFYCTQACKRKSLTAQHSRYVSHNRAHINEYVKARRIRIWGESNPQIAQNAEKFAMETLLPGLGFTELYHASAINRFFPFDFIATYQGQRVLVDVTTGVSKKLVSTYQQSLAEALRMPIFVLFVKPDFSKYQLTLGTGLKTVQMHPAELVSIE